MHIILVEPQLAENIGAVARIMGNFQFAPDRPHQLWLVSPKVSPLEDKAIAMAVASCDILGNAKIVGTLKEAVAQSRMVIGTTAVPRQLIKFYHTPKSCAKDMLRHDPHDMALVFGPERTGLINDDIALCHRLVKIPVNDGRSSLNLSHAVGILMYELFCAYQEPKDFWHTGETEPAHMDDLHQFLDFLEKALDQTHFWRTPAKKAGMKRNLVGMFTRQQWFCQDLKTLRGVIDALQSRP